MKRSTERSPLLDKDKEHLLEDLEINYNRANTAMEKIEAALTGEDVAAPEEGSLETTEKQLLSIKANAKQALAEVNALLKRDDLTQTEIATVGGRKALLDALLGSRMDNVNKKLKRKGKSKATDERFDVEAQTSREVLVSKPLLSVPGDLFNPPNPQASSWFLKSGGILSRAIPVLRNTRVGGTSAQKFYDVGRSALQDATIYSTLLFVAVAFSRLYTNLEMQKYPPDRLGNPTSPGDLTVVDIKNNTLANTPLLLTAVTFLGLTLILAALHSNKMPESFKRHLGFLQELGKNFNSVNGPGSLALHLGLRTLDIAATTALIDGVTLQKDLEPSAQTLVNLNIFLPLLLSLGVNFGYMAIVALIGFVVFVIDGIGKYAGVSNSAVEPTDEHSTRAVSTSDNAADQDRSDSEDVDSSREATSVNGDGGSSAEAERSARPRAPSQHYESLHSDAPAPNWSNCFGLRSGSPK